MPITAYSQKFERELDPDQLLSLLGYNLDSDPNLKNIPKSLRDYIHSDLRCPECGTDGGIIVSRSTSRDGSIKLAHAIRQSHFRFLARDSSESTHHPLCIYHDDSKPKSQKESLVDFNRTTRSFTTQMVRDLVARGVEQKIFSQRTIRAMRQWFFDTKVENQFKLELPQEAIPYTFKLFRLVGSGSASFNPVHAELPDFDWKHAAECQFARENSVLINLADTLRKKCYYKAKKRAETLVKRTQGKEVFDVTVLADQYRQTIKLAGFMKRNLRVLDRRFKFFEYSLHEKKELAPVVAIAALLLYTSSWNFDQAVMSLVKIIKAPPPSDMNAGNIVGLNPFHDFAAWANIMVAKELTEHSSFIGFDIDAQLSSTELQLREQFSQWKQSQ